MSLTPKGIQKIWELGGRSCLIKFSKSEYAKEVFGSGLRKNTSELIIFSEKDVSSGVLYQVRAISGKYSEH